jgi:hypothetical protein
MRFEDIFAFKNPTASAGFELANLGIKGQHATFGPLKPRLPKLIMAWIPGERRRKAVQVKLGWTVYEQP